MKSVDLRTERPGLSEILRLAEEDTVLLVTPGGQEYILAEVDNFEAEAEALRNSPRFQSFLDQRLSSSVRIPIEEIEREVEKELQSG